MSNIDNKIAIVTGGASGIGEATARIFAHAGAVVIIADVEADRGQYVAEKLGPRTHYVQADVSKEADVQQLIEWTIDKYGRLDCMFNNAGVPGPAGAIDATTVESFDATVAVNLRGVFLGIKHAAPVMKRQGKGSIINTASIAGMVTGYAGHAYSCTKAAVIQLTRSTAMELGESNVRVNCICPGVIATPIFGKAFGLSADAASQTIDRVRDTAASTFKQPIPRGGTPEDVAKAALWLASDDASFVNGHALVLDGGIAAGRGWSETQDTWMQLASAMRITG